jgi:hypothetical protein
LISFPSDNPFFCFLFSDQLLVMIGVTWAKYPGQEVLGGAMTTICNRGPTNISLRARPSWREKQGSTRMTTFCAKQ